MNYKFFDRLCDEAIMIREEVFVKEQGFVNEFDDTDLSCLHLVVYKDDQAIGCARMYEKDDAMVIGRVAVLPFYRKQKIGTYIIDVLELKAKELGYKKTVLSAQLRASEFYLKLGYSQYGKEYYDEYCLHISMEKLL